MTVDRDAEELVELARLRRFVRTGEAEGLRERAGLSQVEVAAAVGTSNVTIHRWESGTRVPHGAPALAYWRLLQQLMRSERRARRAG